MRHIWWVNQKQTYRHERDGGYLWSPKRKANGARNPYYDSMRLVAPGDIVLSYANARIVAFSTSLTYAYEFPKPIEFGAAGTNWSQIGWRIDVAYRDLPTPLHPKGHIDSIRPLLPARYAPLTVDGDGMQNMYLTQLPPALGELLLDLAGVHLASSELNLGDRDLSDGLASAIAQQRTDEWENRIAEQIEQDRSVKETDRAQLILARRGQGLFRKELMAREKACRLTKVENPTHLIASHCKPWRDASHEERLDGENGLLLVPSADHLFDHGFISFDDKGELLLSPVADRHSLHRMGIPVDERINVGNFSSGQRNYLEFHRSMVFKTAKHLA